MRTSCTEALEGDEGSGGWGMASVLAVLIGKLAIFVGKMMLETTRTRKFESLRVPFLGKTIWVPTTRSMFNLV